MVDKRRTGRGATPQDADSVEKRERLNEWHEATSGHVLKQVKYYRDLRRLTNDELRLRLDRLGWRLTTSSLAGILTGKRRAMPWGEMLLFAQALNVPVLNLMFPVATNERVRLFPGDAAEPMAYQAHRWAAGRFKGIDGPYIAVPDSTDAEDQYFEAADQVATYEDALGAIEKAWYTNGVLLVQPSDAAAQLRMVEHLTHAWVELESLADRYPEAAPPLLAPQVQFLLERPLKFPDLPIEGWEYYDFRPGVDKEPQDGTPRE